MKGLMSYKCAGGSVKDVDTSKKRIAGYLTAFGNVDHDNDVGVKGMFEKTIKERGPQGKNEIFFLNQHQWREPHGKFAELKEDDHGLYFVSNPLPDTTWSKDAMELYATGIINEHSYGFHVVKAEYDYTSKINTLHEVKLYEGSNVTLGANSETPFLGFKSGMPIEDQIAQIHEKAKAISQVLRHGTVTDETMLRLEIGLKELISHSVELGKKSTEEPERKVTTLEPGQVQETLNAIFH